MSRNIEYGIGEFYHIYNRGTEKRKIFTSTSNYNRFLALLYICNGSVEVHLQRQGRTLTEIGDVERGSYWWISAPIVLCQIISIYYCESGARMG